MDVQLQDGRTEDLKPFPEKCPKCASFARYVHSIEKIDSVPMFGHATWECGYDFMRQIDEVFGRVVEIEAHKCRRVPS